MQAAEHLDTTGSVPQIASDGDLKAVMWSDLDAFTQGYVEALLDRPELRDSGVELGFADLSPEALALIVADCDSYLRQMPGTNNRDMGARFWNSRQFGDCKRAGFPPLTVTLGEDGKVHLAVAQ